MSARLVRNLGGRMVTGRKTSCKQGVLSSQCTHPPTDSTRKKREFQPLHTSVVLWTEIVLLGTEQFSNARAGMKWLSGQRSSVVRDRPRVCVWGGGGGSYSPRGLHALWTLDLATHIVPERRQCNS